MERIFFERKVIVWLVFAAGLIGAVCFFPFNFGGEYTCLFHRLVSHPVGGHASVGTGMQQQQKGGGAQISGSGQAAVRLLPRHPDLVRDYYRAYAPFWWGSLLLLVAATGILRRKGLFHFRNE